MVVSRAFSRKPITLEANKSWNDLGVGADRKLMHTLQLGGVSIDGMLRWSKSESSYSAGSSASIQVKILEDDLLAVAQAVVPLEIGIYTSMWIDGKAVFTDAEEFVGVIDQITLQRSQGIYEISARSYAQILLNEHVSSVITGNANSPRLTTDVITEVLKQVAPTMHLYIDPGIKATPVGKIYKDRRVKPVVNMSAWDLFESFAKADNVDVYVKGTTVFYVRKPTDTSDNITELNGVKASYTYVWGKNILDLSLSHAPLFSHDITVTVKTYNPRTGEDHQSVATLSDIQVSKLAATLEQTNSNVLPNLSPTVKGAPAAAKLPGYLQNQVSSGIMTAQAAAIIGKSQAKVKRAHIVSVQDRVHAAHAGTNENYTFFIPAGNQADCDKVAIRIAEDISRQEFRATLKVLGQPDLNPLQYIRLQNTGSKVADQVYAIRNIETSSEIPSSGGNSSGYVTTLTLVNHAIQTSGPALG